MTHAELANAYARDVVEGRQIACRYVVLACQRHLDDLAESEKPGARYYFDADEANRWCRFVELMPHVKGKWSRARETIKLEPWQCFTIAVPFGWRKRSNDKRRFRRVYEEEPRKQAKSTKVAALGLGMLTMDGEDGAEVYSGAGTEVQAWEVFGPAKKMAERSERFCEAGGVKVNAKNLVVHGTNSKFVPVIGKPGDGASPTFAITDEYHEHATEEQYDTMITGMGSREQPMSWVITTAGFDTAGPCYALRTEAIEVLEGKVENPELFAIIYTIDDDVDWTSEDALRMANPNMGVSVFEEYLLSQQRDAINNPRKQVTFKTKHLCVWVGAAAPYFNLEKWNRLGDVDLSADDFVGDPCWIATDLAAKLDITASGKLFRREIDGADHYFWFPRFYVPHEVAHDPANRRYSGWVEQGHLIATPGNVTDFGRVEDDIVADAKEHSVQHCSFDPWNSMQMSQQIAERTGVECIDIPMTVKHLSDPMKWAQALIVDGRMHHDANPVMAWMIGNVTAQEDRMGNVFPRKEKQENKIDGPIALIMALERGFQLEQEGSYLETEDALWLD